MIKSQPKLSLLTRLSCLGVGIALSSELVLAQTNDENAERELPRRLETITVTAQKRESALQDTPISVAAISGEKIAAQGIQRAEELATLVPNFSIQQDPIGDKINIRGIQSGNNAGLEQSVGTFVDGTYRGRGVQTRYAFLDVERVEVLRGPQGTLFGKNTNGGAINITSARPTDELAGRLSIGGNFSGVDEYEVSGFVSGPLTDRLRGRIAGQYRDTQNGYIDNLFYNEDEPTTEEFAFRGTLEWDATDKTLVTTRIEVGDFDQRGQPFGNIEGGPIPLFVDAQEGSFRSSNIGSTNPVLDIGSAGNHEGDSLEASVTVKHDFDDGTLTLSGAYSQYDFQRELDADFSALDLLRFDDNEDFDQFSFEVRYDGQVGSRLNYTVGGYYLQSNLLADADTIFNVRADGTDELAVDTVLDAACDALTAAGLDPAGIRECILIGAVEAFDGTPLEYRDFTRVHFLDQDSEVAAVFGQFDFNVTDRLSIGAGIRYTYEEKTAVQGAFAAEFGDSGEQELAIDPVTGQTQLFVDAFLAQGLDPATAAAQGAALDPFFSLGEAEIHETDLARVENAVTWSFNVAYDVTDNILVYASGSSGFKAGGFNSFALSADPAEAEFEEEEVVGFEIGAKTTFLNGAAELNFAAFNSNFDDIQTAIFTGSTSFIVQNAAEARSRGVEIDGRWAITDKLLLSGGVSYVDFEFLDFPNAACFAEQLLDFRVATGNPLATLQNCANPTLAEAEAAFAAGLTTAVPDAALGDNQVSLNELTGRQSENTPELSGSFSLQYSQPIGQFELVSVADVLFSSAQFRQADLDPVSFQGGFAKVNLQTTFGPQEGTWDVSFVVKNLFNEETFNYANDTPLVDGARQFAPERPRTIGLRFNLRY